MRTNTKTNSKKKPYIAEPIPWQEAQHYEWAFEKWLEKNVSKQAGEAYGNIRFLSLLSQHGIGPKGHTSVRRSRNMLKKFLPKFNMADWKKDTE